MNPSIPRSTIEIELSKILNPNILSLCLPTDRSTLLTKGLKVTYQQDNETIGKQLKIIDFDDPENNDWLVVNQFTIHGNKHNRRPDVIVFVNGLPLSVIELKNVADQHADIWAAYNQLQTYKNDILIFHNICM